MSSFNQFNLATLLYPSAVGLSIFGLQSIYNCAVRHIAKPFLSSYTDCMPNGPQKNLSQRIEDTLLKMMTYVIAICTMMEGRTLVPVLVTTPIDYRQAFMGLIMCLAIKNQYNKIIQALHCKLTGYQQQIGRVTSHRDKPNFSHSWSQQVHKKKTQQHNNNKHDNRRSNQGQYLTQSQHPVDSACPVIRYCGNTLWLLDFDDITQPDRQNSQAYTC